MESIVILFSSPQLWVSPMNDNYIQNLDLSLLKHKYR